MASRIARLVPFAAFLLSMGFAFGALAGCGGSQEGAFARGDGRGVETGRPIPEDVAESLASCEGQVAARLVPGRHAIRFNVYVTEEGQAVSAYVLESTLGDSDTEACMAGALRASLWPVRSAA